MTGIWAAIWPHARKGRPLYRHYFDEEEAAEFGHTMKDARSLCRQTFSPLASWYHGGQAVAMTKGECPACRARLNKLTTKTVCAWCQTRLSGPEESENLSHGICQDCLHEHFPEEEK